MRLRVELPDGLLRQALGELLEDAGHEIVASGPADGVRLQVLLHPGAGAPWPRVPTLYLRPGAGGRGSPAPADALREALRTGGVAIWSPPLDADLLVECLATEGARPVRRSLAPPDGAPLRDSPDLWLLLDPRTREVHWATSTARTRFLTPNGSRLSPRGEQSLPAAWPERAEGCEVVTMDDVPHLASWWTDTRGRRCLGYLRLPPPSRASGSEDVETLAELGRVSATLAHEIRNPLASFAGALDLLENEFDPEERASILWLARERVDQMRTMLDEALRLIRPFRLSPASLDPVEVVRSAVAAVRTDGRFKDIEVRVEPDASRRNVLSHAEPLRQAVIDLLLNAAQAGAAQVSVRFESGPSHATIRVADDGPGIPANVREKVFTPFWTTKDGGTGLGLTFVRRVVEASGGKVWVEEAPRGACLRIDLPRAGS
jgi:signal transduction histidine kinase